MVKLNKSPSGATPIIKKTLKAWKDVWLKWNNLLYQQAMGCIANTLQNTGAKIFWSNSNQNLGILIWSSELVSLYVRFNGLLRFNHFHILKFKITPTRHSNDLVQMWFLVTLLMWSRNPNIFNLSQMSF